MSNAVKCPQCGEPLPVDAPAGLCPGCLMALNLKTETWFTDEAAAAQAPLPPEMIAPHFPQLEILGCLGRGGMGVVYKTRQKTLNRLAALKLLAPERVRDAKFAERFTREAQALAVLNHPNIVTIYDFGQAGGYYYLLMEFVDGANLRQLLRTRRFTPEEALAVIPPLCDALQFAHDHGIVHRDIKPENLLLDKAGRIKVADFGIAKMLGTENGGKTGEPMAGENATQNAMGTPGYSAPEQKANPQRVDSRADIYSLGVVFYEMLTGELPGKRIEPPSRKVQIDVRLDEIVLRALEKTPELRYQQVSEVRTCVETLGSRPAPGAGMAGMVNPTPSRNFEYRSKASVFGLPWLHVVKGVDPATGKQSTARGVVAIGARAKGVLAIGNIAFGVVAIGAVAVGGVAIGAVSLGLLAVGALALGLIGAYGGLAAALFASGGLALGVWSEGGLAIGTWSQGGLAIGMHSRGGLALHPVFLSTEIIVFFLMSSAVVCSGIFFSVFARLEHGANQESADGYQGLRRGFFNYLKKYFFWLACILCVAWLVRVFWLQPFVAVTDSAAPAIPKGSHFLVWKLAHHFIPGDFAVYTKDGQANLGRVVADGSAGLIVNRNGQGDVPIPAGQILGKVISVYWRETSQPSDSSGNPLGKTIVLERATNQVIDASAGTRMVTVWSDTSLLPNEKLHALVKGLDDQIVDAFSMVAISSSTEGDGVSTGFNWNFKEEDGFGAEEADAATAQIREHWMRHSVRLVAGTPQEIFSVTNQQGGTLTGYVEFDRVSPQPPDAAGQIKAKVQIVYFGLGTWQNIGYNATVPAGYRLRATASQGNAHTETPGGPYQYNSSWFRPLGPMYRFGSEDTVWNVPLEAENETNDLTPENQVRRMEAPPLHFDWRYTPTLAGGVTNIPSASAPTNFTSTNFSTFAQRLSSIQRLAGRPPHYLHYPVQRMGMTLSKPFDVVLGQPRLIFSVTNGPDDVYQGFLELAGPAPAPAAK